MAKKLFLNYQARIKRLEKRRLIVEILNPHQPEKIEIARQVVRRIEEYVKKQHIWLHPKLDGTLRTPREIAKQAIAGFIGWDARK